MAKRRKGRKMKKNSDSVPRYDPLNQVDETIEDTADVFEPQNNNLDDFRPPANLKITTTKPRLIKGQKHEIVFTRKKVKAGKFKKLDDFTWNMIHAKKNEIVGKISTLLKPIRNYSRKNKRELIQSLGVMKEKVQKFY